MGLNFVHGFRFLWDFRLQNLLYLQRGYQSAFALHTVHSQQCKMASVIAKIEQLSPRVIRVLGCNPGMMTLQGTNTYLVGTGRQRILVDTGEPDKPDYIKNLKQTLQEHKFVVDSIILTHWHLDHVGGIKDVEDNVLNGKTVPLYKFKRSTDEHGKECPPNTKSSYTFVDDEHVIKSEGATLRLIYTPGHTDDHMVLYLEEEGALFSADCILGEGTAVFDDLHDYMLSLKKIVEMKPLKIYPGHGPVIEDPVDKINYYISHRQQRENQILECLSRENCAMTSMEIVKKVYADVGEHLHQPANVNVINHLGKLKRENKVTFEGEKYFLIKSRI